MAIVESGPISIKLDMGTAIQMLSSDPEFAEKLRLLVKEHIQQRLAKQAKEKNTDG